MEMKPEITAGPGSAAPRCPHLAPAVCALLAAAALLAGARVWVQGRLPSLLPFYSAHAVPLKINGNLLRTAAFRAPAVLSVYGSSELDLWAGNRTDAFFRHRPTGFAVFAVGRGGGSCLSILQKLVAAGDAARGQKVVVILSPTWFLEANVDADALDANLGAPQLGAWIFHDALSPTLKTAIARRMQDFPDLLKKQTLLAGAVRCLAEPTSLRRLGFALLRPAGRFQDALMGPLESGAILWEMAVPQRRWRREGERDQDPPPVTHGRIDWDLLAAQVEAEDRKLGNGTIYSAGVLPGNPDYRPREIPPTSPGAHDQEFVAQLKNSREFDDLALLIRVLKEMKMDPLFLSQPFNGVYRDLTGVSADARRVYYERLENLLTSAGYPLFDFSAREGDRTFFYGVEHPSAKAWIFYDREIDRFYSGRRD